MIIRFAGDSGDGMQLTGDRFTTTLPDFPEIRAPAGTLPGFFQVHFADTDILTRVTPRTCWSR